MNVFIGTYTNHSSPLEGSANTGIALYDFCEREGTLKKQTTIPHPENPSFLAFDSASQVLYAVAEADRFRERDGGGVLEYRISKASGQWQESASTNSGGSAPCHLRIDPAGPFLFAANYTGGSVAMLELSENEPLQIRHLAQHEGSSAHPTRQTGPHAHQTLVDPSGDFLFVSDLGTDKICIYRIDRDAKRLEAHSLPHITLPSGSGPRHMAYHSDSSTLYSLNELNATVATLSIQAPYSEYTLRNIQSTLPEGCRDEPSTAEIAIHPNRRFLYASNRNHDSIALFQIDRRDGSLSQAKHFPTGQTPRNFAIDPSGEWLISAHQDEGSLQVWSIDPGSGVLKPVGKRIEEAAPVCVCFAY